MEAITFTSSSITIIIIQGMTIRTAQMPVAGNLLSQAGEDVSGLPDQTSWHQFF